MATGYKLGCQPVALLKSRELSHLSLWPEIGVKVMDSLEEGLNERKFDRWGPVYL